MIAFRGMSMNQRAYHVRYPEKHLSSVVFASPHSGRDYSDSFLGRSVLDKIAIRSSEDAFVDLLFEGAPDHGAVLLCADVPRAYVDLNRSADELDPALIHGVRRQGHNPRVASGLGVIPRVVSNGRAIYDGKLTLSEAQQRIDDYWTPYHRMLQSLLDRTHRRREQSILIDCHSMPHEAIEGCARRGAPAPDIVLGDRFGAACHPEIVDQIEHAFVRAGFRVVRNTPFAGAFITQSYGRPSRGQHAVQVEIDRSLYMDERKIEPRPQFGDVQRALAVAIAEITRIGRVGLPLAAE
jgi:N-formylglutamate deformylase